MRQTDATRRTWQVLRWILLGLAIADVAFGIIAIVNPYIAGPYASPLETDRFYVRIIGVFWIFMAYVALLGWRDPVRNLLAVQLTFTLRLPTGLLNLAELILEQPYWGHAAFGVADLAIWATGVTCLKLVGRRWWAW